MTYRVIQWASGNVGTKSVQALLDNPDLELVGMFVHSAIKDGMDVGDICGLGRQIGVKATSSVDGGRLRAAYASAIAYLGR